MSTREKIQQSVLIGTKLELTQEEVKSVYDLIGWATRYLNMEDDDHNGKSILYMLGKPRID